MTSADSATTPSVKRVLLVLAWLWVLVPFLYGLIALLLKVPALFSV
ncbi:MAG: hypothetical protein L0I76_34345 [Pseudonocardia sp.]|nr:hypothetical protein [Pseudonocardia sp.]